MTADVYVFITQYPNLDCKTFKYSLNYITLFIAPTLASCRSPKCFFIYMTLFIALTLTSYRTSQYLLFILLYLLLLL